MARLSIENLIKISTVSNQKVKLIVKYIYE